MKQQKIVWRFLLLNNTFVVVVPSTEIYQEIREVTDKEVYKLYIQMDKAFSCVRVCNQRTV